MQRAFLPSLLKSSKRMEIQEISGETQKLVPTHSLFIFPQCLPFPEPHTLGGKKTLPLSLGTTESAAPGQGVGGGGQRKANVSCVEALGGDNIASSRRGS